MAYSTTVIEWITDPAALLAAFSPTNLIAVGRIDGWVLVEIYRNENNAVYSNHVGAEYMTAPVSDENEFEYMEWDSLEEAMQFFEEFYNK